MSLKSARSIRRKRNQECQQNKRADLLRPGEIHNECAEENAKGEVGSTASLSRFHFLYSAPILSPRGCRRS